MRFLVDVGVGIAVEDCLRADGHDVNTVRARSPSMPDPDILAWAVAEQRLLITMDKDFGNLVFHSGQAHAGILLLRMQHARSAEKVQVARAIIAQFGHLLSGRFAVYQSGRLRIR